jgi:hypothetical protein
MNANLTISGAKSPDEIGIGEPDTIGQENRLRVSKAASMCERGLRIISDIFIIESHEFPWNSIGGPNNLPVLIHIVIV